MLRIICRTCLALDGEFLSIYDSKGLFSSSCVADMVGDLTSNTPHKSDGMPEMVCLACIKEINRCHFFKRKCLNSESMLKQLLKSCEDTQDAAITDTECILLQEQVKMPDADFVKADEEPYVVIDLEDESERMEIKHEVEKHMLNSKEDKNVANASIPIEKEQNAEAAGYILPQADTPDVEFVETDKVPCVVVDLEEESESLEVEKDLMSSSSIEENENVDIAITLMEGVRNAATGRGCIPAHEQVFMPDAQFEEIDKVPCVVIDSEEENQVESLYNEDNTVIKKKKSAEARGFILSQVDLSDVEFVENDKVPCVVIDSDEESDHMEIELEVEEDLQSSFRNEGNDNVDTANTLIEAKQSADTRECILPNVKTDEEPYVVIDLVCESERLEIEHEVEKHLQLLCSNEESVNVANADIRLEKKQFTEATEYSLPQIDMPEVRFVENDKQSHIIVDSEQESEGLAVEKHMQLLYCNEENVNVANADIQTEEMRNVETRACILPQVDVVDVEFVETNKESYIVIDSDDENVQFEIEDDLEEHTTQNIDPKPTANSVKNTEELEPSFTVIHLTEEESEAANANSDEFMHIFDYFDAGGEGEPNQYGSVDYASPGGNLQCTQCAMNFLDPKNLREHMTYCEIIRQDKPRIKQCTSSFQFNISSSSINVDRGGASGSINHRTSNLQLRENYVNNTRLHRCPICQECFAQKLLLTHHMRLHPGGTQFYCSICKRGFTNKSSLNEHTLRHSEKKPIKCEECPRSFYSRKELRLHVRMHTGDSPFVCYLCHLFQPSSTSDKDTDCRKTGNYSDQKENAVVKVKGDSDADKTSDVTSENMPCSSSTQKNELTDNEEHNKQAKERHRQLYMQAHRCSHCGAGFVKKKSLEIHTKQLMCSLKPFFCSKCKYHKSSSRKKATRRVVTPTCDICSLVFTNDDDRLKHNLETHKVKNQCPICKKIVKSISIVKVHMRRHKGERPFACPLCNSAFVRQGCLNQHMLRHRKTKPFKCEKCPLSFIKKAELTSHFRRHTGERPYACQICPKRYAAWSGLRSHQLKHIDKEVSGSILTMAPINSCEDEVIDVGTEECMHVDGHDVITVESSM